MSRPQRPASGRPPADRPAAAPERAGRGRSDDREAASRPGRAGAGATVADVEDEAPPAPWHFKVLLFATAGYLVYRLIWLVFWLTGHAWHG